MPNCWVHAVIDLIVYGRPYFDIHKKKDEPSKILGRKHRIINHDWYQAFGEKWNMSEPFPSCIKELTEILRKEKGGARAEEQMAWIDHDYIDKTWDFISNPEKKYREGFFAWILLNPDILKNWAGVDVLGSKIQRVIDSNEIWESCPELESEYNRLCIYVKAVIQKDEILRNYVESGGR
ncbi:MAG: hypothetical protein AB1498_00805 [bacterium]